MKASELIEQLTENIRAWGDGEVIGVPSDGDDQYAITGLDVDTESNEHILELS